MYYTQINVHTCLKKLFWLCEWLLGFDIDSGRLQIACVICKQFPWSVYVATHETRQKLRRIS